MIKDDKVNMKGTYTITTFDGCNKKGNDLLLSPAIIVVVIFVDRDDDAGTKATVVPIKHAEITANLININI